MWEPRRLTACYRDSFTCFYLYLLQHRVNIRCASHCRIDTCASAVYVLERKVMHPKLNASPDCGAKLRATETGTKGLAGSNVHFSEHAHFHLSVMRVT
jgi:hypothetical protein